jgi:hypothetical protein
VCTRGPFHDTDAAGRKVAVMAFGYIHGGYLIVRTRPSPDVDDDDDSTLPCWRSHRQRQDKGWSLPDAWTHGVQPGTKESCNRSRLWGVQPDMYITEVFSSKQASC